MVKKATKRSPLRFSSYPSFFLHFFNREIIELYTGQSISQVHLYSSFLALSRYSLLITQEPIIIPASSFFEIPFIDRYLHALRDVRNAGLIEFWSPTPELEEYAIKKRSEYRDQSPIFGGYTSRDPVPKSHMEGLIWKPRILRSASRDIKSAWGKSIENNNSIWSQILDRSELFNLPTEKIENAIETVPQRLDGRAFVIKNVSPLMPFQLTSRDEVQINHYISRAYIDSLLDEYDALIWYQTNIGDLDCGITSLHSDGKSRKVSYRRVVSILDMLDLRKSIDALSWENLIKLRSFIPMNWLANEIIEFARGNDYFLKELQFCDLKTKKSQHNFLKLSGLLDRVAFIQDSMIEYRNKKSNLQFLQLDRVKNNLQKKNYNNNADITIVIALSEEFRSIFKNRKLHSRWVENGKFYMYRFTWGEYICDATFVGGMGVSRAALHTVHAIIESNAKTVINLGIAGAMTDDIALGDIVIGDIIDNYLEDSKAEQLSHKTNAGFQFHLSGNPFRATDELVTHSENIEFAHPELYQEFLESSANRRTSVVFTDKQKMILKEGNLFRSDPKVLVGHIASGSIVGMSSGFTDWLITKRDRKYCAIEMESAGVLSACEKRNVKSFVIRGISDLSDERKGLIDDIGDGVFREIAIQESVSFLDKLIKAEIFEFH